jgi:hypothetical protein
MTRRGAGPTVAWTDRFRAIVGVTVEPIPGDPGARVTIDVDFTGHGIGRLLVPLIVRRQAAREMPGNMSRLRQRLSAATGT